jgi:hypothetical protein
VPVFPSPAPVASVTVEARVSASYPSAPPPVESPCAAAPKPCTAPAETTATAEAGDVELAQARELLQSPDQFASVVAAKWKFRSKLDLQDERLNEKLRTKGLAFVVETILRSLQRVEKDVNPELAYWILSRIAGKSLLIEGPFEKLRGEAARYKTHAWAIFGSARIQLSEAAFYGILENVLDRDELFKLDLPYVSSRLLEICRKADGKAEAMAPLITEWFGRDELESRAALLHAFYHFSGFKVDAQAHELAATTGEGANDDAILACTAMNFPTLEIAPDAKAACETCARIEGSGKKARLNPSYVNSLGSQACR